MLFKGKVHVKHRAITKSHHENKVLMRYKTDQVDLWFLNT